MAGNLSKIAIYQGDITKMGVDAIVNAANPSLLGGGGVDGAIHMAAGPELKAYCRNLHGCAVGEAKITPGFRLPATYVIHTAGPIWQGGGRQEAEKLAACYRNSLALAAEQGLQTLAFPAISTGVYGYPQEEAAQIACQTIAEALTESPLEKVYLVAFTPEMAALYSRVLEQISAAE